MTTYDEERLGELLRLLPPAPPGWVEAAQELPRARADLDALIARAEADAAFRQALVDDVIDRLDEAMEVRDGLAQLGPDCREILDRFFARDESYRTIGDALSIPPGTIASRISRCLGHLRDELEESR